MWLLAMILTEVVVADHPEHEHVNGVSVSGVMYVPPLLVGGDFNV